MEDISCISGRGRQISHSNVKAHGKQQPADRHISQFGYIILFLNQQVINLSRHYVCKVKKQWLPLFIGYGIIWSYTRLPVLKVNSNISYFTFTYDAYSTCKISQFKFHWFILKFTCGNIGNWQRYKKYDNVQLTPKSIFSFNCESVHFIMWNRYIFF